MLLYRGAPTVPDADVISMHTSTVESKRAISVHSIGTTHTAPLGSRHSGRIGDAGSPKPLTRWSILRALKEGMEAMSSASCSCHDLWVLGRARSCALKRGDRGTVSDAAGSSLSGRSGLWHIDNQPPTTPSAFMPGGVPRLTDLTSTSNGVLWVPLQVP